MDNRKKASTGSGWLEETGSRFRREPEIRKRAGNQEPAGFGTAVEPVHRFRIGTGSKGINFWILPPLPTFVQVLPRAFKAPKP